MSGDAPDSALSDARREVSQACECLRKASPAALDECATRLEVATLKLRGVERPANPELAAGLRHELGHARTLLETAACYYANWSRRLGELTGGYRSDGQPAEVVRPGRWSVSA